MSRISAYCIIIASFITALVSCNSTTEEIDTSSMLSSAIVKDFYFKEDTKVLDNLQNVFFSIDLNDGRIFNADSMPYGTKISRLIPIITTGGASAVELVVPRPGQSDTTYNYLTNSTDSIDFSNGPVTLRIVSYDELTTMNYTINVNVHKVKSDSLTWSKVAYSKLPTALQSVKEQHTLKFEGAAYCLTTDGSQYSLAVSDSPAAAQWQSLIINLPFTANVKSFRASSDALYLLDTARHLYKSTDKGITWSQTSYSFDYLIGGYSNYVIGTVNDGGTWKIATSEGLSVDAPADFPVSGTSMSIEYGFEMSDSRQLTIVGGRTAAGDLSDKSWGYDGTNWACLTQTPLPVALEDCSLAPYFIYEENSFFIATKYSIFIALGGRNDEGMCNDSTFISYDYGMNWHKASDLMQLPDAVPAMADAQALVFTSELTSRGSLSAWTPIDVPTRASTVIKSWECPYIYLFGGTDAASNTYDTIWRAAINRLTFKPLQ